MLARSRRGWEKEFKLNWQVGAVIWMKGQVGVEILSLRILTVLGITGQVRWSGGW